VDILIAILTLALLAVAILVVSAPLRAAWRHPDGQLEEREKPGNRIAQAEGGSPERALEILAELSELAKAVEEELERAKRAAEADAAQS